MGKVVQTIASEIAQGPAAPNGGRQRGRTDQPVRAMARAFIAAAIVMVVTCTPACRSVSSFMRPPPRVGEGFPVLHVAPVASTRTARSAAAVAHAGVVPEAFGARTLLLYLCAAGCPACKRGDEQVRELAARLQAPGQNRPTDRTPVPVAVVMLNTSRRAALRIQRRNGWTFPVFTDPTGEARRRLGRVATPCFCILQAGPNGPVLAARHCGVFDNREDMLALVAAARRAAAGEYAPPLDSPGRAEQTNSAHARNEHACRGCCCR